MAQNVISTISIVLLIIAGVFSIIDELDIIGSLGSAIAKASLIAEAFFLPYA